jgi:hypothetical protein
MSRAGALNVAPPFGKPTHARTDARRVTAKLQGAPSSELGNGLDNPPQDRLLLGKFCIADAGSAHGRGGSTTLKAASGLAAVR